MGEHVWERMVSALPVGNGAKHPLVYLAAVGREKNRQEKTRGFFLAPAGREEGCQPSGES